MVKSTASRFSLYAQFAASLCWMASGMMWLEWDLSLFSSADWVNFLAGFFWFLANCAQCYDEELTHSTGSLTRTPGAQRPGAQQPNQYGKYGMATATEL
ncbi:hypothetical protein TrLO_g15483 [Triparma laevis f. longispina]|uniref:Uncharacterized protein n=1 Tax=Triparma laevis f. longispina TaxID=1714387 RepID=A0A9W7FG56_9STRA|nr:hypothetical protein TrLO_g15483 [Triparma laevis f. longispina]